MSNVLEFKAKSAIVPSTSMHMFTMSMNQDQNGEYEVYMEVSEDFADEEVHDAMFSAWMKFGLEQGLLEDEDDTD